MKKTNNRVTKELVENKNLASILGVIEGDGCVSIYKYKKNIQYQVKLDVIDKDFSLAFKKVLEKWAGIEVGFHIYENQAAPYHVQSYSKSVVIFLKKYNTINKVEKMVKKVNGEKEFLRSMYDSDGGVSIRNKAVVLYNTNKQLLLLCKKFLKRLNIESSKIGINRKKGTPYKAPCGTGFSNFDYYTFSINNRCNLIKFRDLVGFNIKRKQDKLIKEINSYKYKK